MPGRTADRLTSRASAGSGRAVLAGGLAFPLTFPLAFALALALAMAYAPPALAQGLGFFQQLFQPPPPPTYAYPPQVERPHIVRRIRRAVRPVEKKPETPAVPPSFFVAVMGDSLGQMLAQGLTDAFADRPDVAILRKARDSSGLVRSDFYDWVKATRDLLASGEKINVAVMLIGSNDHQPLRDGTASYEPHAPKWDEIYDARIAAIAGQFRDKKIPMIWVGLPVMRSDRMSKEALALNEMYKEHAGKAGATYVDIWEAFGDDHGAFAASGPDIDGQVVRLRSADGIHFTKAGARKLAHFVEDEIRRILDATQPADGSAFAKLSPAPQGPDLPQQPADAVPTLPRPKPAIGPVLSLTGAPVSPDGALVTRAATGLPLPRPEQDPAAAAPQPGRADDFAWPPRTP